MKTTPKPSTVRSLGRGLDVLAEVSRRGECRPSEIAKALALPRPSVYRLLDALEQFGYVRRSASDGRFRVTIKVRTLAEGYDNGTRLSELAGPVLSRLGQELIWPIDLSSHEDGAMVVRETTHGRSPLSIDRNMVGYRLPILRTASGRAWLAHSTEAVRNACLTVLQARADPEDAPYLEPSWIGSMLATVREQGYGSRFGEVGFLPKTSSFGVPILFDGEVAGCVTVIWITNALPISTAEAELLPPLRAAADAIAVELAGG